MNKSGVSIILAVSMAASLSSGRSKTAVAANVDYNSKSFEQIVKDAKKEGKVNSVGMPDTWANWIGTWQEIEKEYGIKHEDLDMSSAEEIALFKEEGRDGTKDIGDVGQQWGPVAEKEGVTLKYKTSYWDEIPSWAKDDDGDWIVCYVGTISMITNNTLVEKAPASFQEVLEGDYKVTIGDVSAASHAQHAILATAYAMGGDMDNLQPAYDFWTPWQKKAGSIPETPALPELSPVRLR